MTHSFDDAGKYGAEFMGTGLKSFAAVSKGAQAIAAEASEFTRQQLEAGGAVIESLVSAKSLEKAIEVQTDYARQAYEGCVAEATRIGDLYATMAKEAYKPFESIVAKAR